MQIQIGWYVEHQCQIGCGKDITEAQSPPRTSSVNITHGLDRVLSFDHPRQQSDRYSIIKAIGPLQSNDRRVWGTQIVQRWCRWSINHQSLKRERQNHYFYLKMKLNLIEFDSRQAIHNPLAEGLCRVLRNGPAIWFWLFCKWQLNGKRGDEFGLCGNSAPFGDRIGCKIFCR